MKKYLAIMVTLVTSILFNMVYADIVIPESGLLVCTPDRPYTVSKENGSIGIEEGQKPCIVEAEENPFILYSIEKSDYCIDMDYIGSNCGKGGSGGKGEASGPFPDKLNLHDTNKLAEYNQGRYNTNRGQFFDKGIGGCIRGSSLNFSGEISAMGGCSGSPGDAKNAPSPKQDPVNKNAREHLWEDVFEKYDNANGFNATLDADVGTCKKQDLRYLCFIKEDLISFDFVPGIGPKLKYSYGIRVAVQYGISRTTGKKTIWMDVHISARNSDYSRVGTNYTLQFLRKSVPESEISFLDYYLELNKNMGEDDAAQIITLVEEYYKRTKAYYDLENP